MFFLGFFFGCPNALRINYQRSAAATPYQESTPSRAATLKTLPLITRAACECRLRVTAQKLKIYCHKKLKTFSVCSSNRLLKRMFRQSQIEMAKYANSVGKRETSVLCAPLPPSLPAASACRGTQILKQLQMRASDSRREAPSKELWQTVEQKVSLASSCLTHVSTDIAFACLPCLSVPLSLCLLCLTVL